jgi:hypothetical protein
MSEKRAPWLKWYPADWRADPRLRMCSLAARGLWIEMLGFMHEAESYGYLLIAGIAPSPEEIAVLVGAPAPLVRKALEELETRGVYSRDDDGVIYSRRMVRDKAKADVDRANGKRGGNPLLSDEVNPSLDLGVNPPDKAQRPEARSQKPEKELPPTSSARPHDAQAAVDAWNAMAERTGLKAVQRMTPARATQLAARMRESGGLPGIEAAITIVERSAFLTGRRPGGNGHEGWRCTFDFFLKQQSFTKIMEGQYDDREGPPDPSGGGGSLFGAGSRGNGFAAVGAELERRLEERDRGQPQPRADD